MNQKNLYSIIFLSAFYLGSSNFLNAQSGWFLQESPSITLAYTAVSFADAYRGIAVGLKGLVIYTTNGGETWHESSSGTTNNLNGVSLTNSNTAFAVGNSGIIIHTTDGGATWISDSSGTKIDFYAVSFTDANNGTVVGDDGIILRTKNGGKTWVSQNTTGWRTTYYSVCFTDSCIGNILAGDQFLRTTDAGATWDVTKIEEFFNFRMLSFSDANTGAAVGHFSEIIRTTDGGNTWLDISNGIQDNFTAVSCVDSNTIYVAGLSSSIYCTTNGGVTWNTQYSASAPSLSICFSDANTGTAVGYSSLILRTTTGGITDIEDNKNSLLPSEYVLEQNYPNPFNPTTNINYKLPESGFVTITVFDLLGKEIQTLVNEYKNAGSYSIKFNASFLSSGTYFYQLQAGSFSQTRKVMLLK